jgi:hypothetical protein
MRIHPRIFLTVPQLFMSNDIRIQRLVPTGQLTEVTRADRKGQIHQAVDMDTLEILANQCQTGLVVQGVGVWLDNEICHGLLTC